MIRRQGEPARQLNIETRRLLASVLNGDARSHLALLAKVFSGCESPTSPPAPGCTCSPGCLAPLCGDREPDIEDALAELRAHSLLE